MFHHASAFLWFLISVPNQTADQQPAIRPTRVLEYTRPITAAAISTDDANIAFAVLPKTGQDRFPIFVRSLNDNSVIELQGHDGEVLRISFSGDVLASSAFNKDVILWKFRSGDVIKRFQCESTPTEVQVLRPGLLAIKMVGKATQLWKVDNNVFQKVTHDFGTICSIAGFSQSGKYLATGYGFLENWKSEKPGFVKVWDVQNGVLLNTVKGPEREITAISMSEDDKYLAIGDSRGQLAVWDLAANKEIMRNTVHRREIHNVTFVHSSRYVLSASYDGEMHVWDTTRDKIVLQLDQHRKTINSVCLFHTTDKLLTCGDDGVIAIWDLRVLVKQ